MKFKNIATVSNIIFILVSCVPATKAVSTQTTVPTSTHTPISSVSTISPTSIPASSSTPTHAWYISCADPELIYEVISEFESKNATTLDQAYEKGKKDPDFGLETTIFNGKPSYTIDTRAFFLGTKLVSGGNIPSGQVKNILCAYGRLMAPETDGSYLTLPLVIGWEGQNDEFHNFVEGYDRASVSEEGDRSSNITKWKVTEFASLASAQKFFDSLPNGAILKISLRIFSQFKSIDEIVEADGGVYPVTQTTRDFLKMLGYRWTEANLNQTLHGITPTLNRVSVESGDPGLFLASLIYWDEGNLESSR